MRALVGAPAAPSAAFAGLGVLIAGLTAAALACERAWPAHLHAHLWLLVAAGVVWAVTALTVERITPSRRSRALLVTIAIALRVPAWALAPAHSDDVYRYLWDARVQAAGINPYLHAPDAPEVVPLRDEAWAHVNNRNLPTVYPPGAELVFRLSHLVPARPLVGWKLVVAAGDLAVLALLVAWLKRRGLDERRAVVWAWSPLVAIELAQSAHVDGLGALLLAAGLFAWTLERRGLAGALLGLSAAVKLLAIAVLPSLRRGRAWLAFAAVIALVALPYASAGPQLAGSLGEYGRRWRANDGAYALLYIGARAVVDHSRLGGRTDLTASPRLARIITGRDRNQIYPDEVAGFAARVASVALFALVLAAALLRRRRQPDPVEVAVVALGAFLLLTPTLHPWYVLWILPLVTVAGSDSAGGPRGVSEPPRAPWITLAVLVPLAYVPLDGWLAHGEWHEPLWTRALEHGAAWTCLLVAWGAASRAKDEIDRPQSPCKIGKSVKIAIALLLFSTVAHAGVVRGMVSLPAEPRAVDAREGHWRVENGVLPVGPRWPDPRSEVVVVLEPEKTPTRKGDPKTVTVDLHGLRLDPRVLVVQSGTTVAFKNSDRVPHTLFIENMQSAFGPVSQPSGQTRSVRLLEPAEYQVHDEEWPHVEGTVVTVESPFSAQVDDKGGFKLEAPEGKYTLKVWWHGWVLTQPLEVGPKTTDISLQVPAAPGAHGKRSE